MFYELQVKSHVRVPPNNIGKNYEEAIKERLNTDFEGYISQEIGYIISVKEIVNIGEGIIISGDPGIHFETEFKVLTLIPENQEIILGTISDITNFGAFINLGPTDGMIHVSQTMDDFISFSKNKTLTGKETKQVLKVDDKCRARIIAISYKDLNNPKIALTMRQPLLGNLNWLKEKKKKTKK